MKYPIVQKISGLSEPYFSAGFLACLIIFKAITQLYLYQQGFISVAADEFARGVMAWRWAQNPQLEILADLQNVWLPFEKYLNGLMFLLWPDPLLAPRLTVFVASCVLLVALTLLSYELFENGSIARLTAVLVVVQPWYVWLSGTPMLEMYYFAWFFLGVWLLLKGLKANRPLFWYTAGVCFFGAAGFHVQSWTFINLVNLLTLPYFFTQLRQKQFGRAGHLVAYYVLSNSFILLYAGLEWLYTGRVFAFLGHHTSYSLWFYGGYEVSVAEKLWYYPALVGQYTSTIVWIGLLMALVVLGQLSHKGWRFFPLGLALLALSLNSVLNVFSGPPSAAPGRYSLFYLLIFLLYAVYGFYHFLAWGWSNPNPFLRYVVSLGVMVLYGYGLWWGAGRIPQFQGSMPLDAVQVGETLHPLLEQTPGRYMVELVYWDFLAVQLTSQQVDQMVYDREFDMRNRTIPSVLAQDPAGACQSLGAVPELKFVVVRDPLLKEKIGVISTLAWQADVGRWSIYNFSAAGACP